MGKYAATRGFERSTRDWKGPDQTAVDNDISRWLYSDWSEGKYETYKLLNMFPPTREYFNYLLDVRADKEYMARFGMDYFDIHDPRKLSQTSSSSRLGSTIVQTSANVALLYK